MRSKTVSSTGSEDEQVRRLSEIADRAQVSTDHLLDLMAESVDRAAAMGDSAEFSADERRLLDEGHVVFSGPPVQERTAQAVTTVNARLLKESVSVAEAARILGIREDVVVMRLKRRRLAGLRHHGDWRVARWQFTDEGRLLPHLHDVLKHAGNLHPLALARWMTSPDPDLADGERTLSPAQWLATSGPPGPVLDLVSELPAAS